MLTNNFFFKEFKLYLNFKQIKKAKYYRELKNKIPNLALIEVLSIVLISLHKSYFENCEFYYI